MDTIKANATLEEIDKLNIGTFQYWDQDHCIYGQMTGKCNSPRAMKIMSKTYSTCAGRIIGRNDQKFCDLNFFNGHNYTDLEKYIFVCKPETNVKIIKYLKGEIDSIDLKDDIKVKEKKSK